MKYRVEIGGRGFDVEVLGPEVRVGDATFHAALSRVSGGPLCHLVSARGSRTYGLVRQGDRWLVYQAGEVWPAKVTDERTQRLAALKREPGTADAAGLVRAPMPGLVLRVEVEAGQHVPAGGGLVVLEAMKMENEIRSPGPGRIKAVLVEPGQAVEKGAPLVEITAEG